MNKPFVLTGAGIMEYENTGNAGTDDREYSVMPVYEEAF